MCVEVRLKETKTINCGNASTNALLALANSMPHFKRDSLRGLCILVVRHTSIYGVARLARFVSFVPLSKAAEIVLLIPCPLASLV